MVEQSRQPSPVVSLQAGPGEADTGGLFDVNRRISDLKARAVARHLAAIGDKLDLEWAGGRTDRLPSPLHILRPARALTRTVYRELHSHLWGSQGLSAAVKAWIVSTAPRHGLSRAETWTTWVTSLKRITCTDSTRGALVAVALVAAVALLGAAWTEWRS